MQEKVLDVLAEVCDDDIVREDLNVDLFENGLLDSIGFILLITELERKTGIVISPSELDRNQFNTPQKIIDEVIRRKNA